MKHRNRGLIIFTLMGLAPILHGQVVKKLNLDEAIALGIQNSKHLKIDATKIEEATANYLEAKNHKLPSLKVSGSALALANAKVDLRISAPATGGGAGMPTANSAFFGNVSASLPLFAGGKIKYGIQSAEYLINASELAAKNDRLGVEYTIVQAYNNLFKANQQIKLLEENLAASKQRDISFQKLEDNGIIARNDKLKAILQTSNIELQLLDAYNNYGIATINMNLLLGLADDINIEIDNEYINGFNEQQPLAYYLNNAFSSRSDLEAINYQKKAAELNIKASKAENLPTIALTGGYVAADIPKILSVVNAANIGLGIQYNIDNLWKKNTNLARANALDKKLIATQELLYDQIKLEVYREYQNSEFAKRKIAVYEKAADQANENYRVTKNKFNNGLATITELLDADTAQMIANVNVINAKADSELAYRKLLQSAGIEISK